MAAGVADVDFFSSSDDVGGGEDEAVRGDKRTRAEATAEFVLNLDESAGDFRIERAEGHAIGAEHGGEREGKGVTKFAGTFEGGFGLGEFALVKEAPTEDALHFGVLRGDEESEASGFFGVGVATGKVEGASFEFTCFGIVLVPPKGLGGGKKGATISAGGPKFFGLGESGARAKGKEREKGKSHAVEGGAGFREDGLGRREA